MAIIGSSILGALAVLVPQDDARAAAVRAQLQKEVVGEASAPQSAAAQERNGDPILLLLQRLDGEGQATINEARQKLRELGSAVRPILPRYLSQLSPIALRETVRFLLEEAPDAEATAALEQLLGGAEPVARVIVARSLGSVRGPARNSLIDRALASPDTRVRDEALRALGGAEQGDARLLAALPKLSASENSEERRLAAELCGSGALSADPRYAAVLDPLFTDRAPEVRSAALHAWAERVSEDKGKEAVALYDRLQSPADRIRLLSIAFDTEGRFAPLFDRGVAVLREWPEGQLHRLIQKQKVQLADATLAQLMAVNSRPVRDEIANELARRGSAAGVDTAVEELRMHPGNELSQPIFQYVARVAPERLVPLGRDLIGSWSTWNFYETHADAETVKPVLELMRSQVQGHDAIALQRIVRERSDASCFEALLDAMPFTPEAGDPPWAGAVRGALYRLAGPQQIPIVLQRSAEIDPETLQKLLTVLEPHFTAEHAPAVIAAAKRYVAARGALLGKYGDLLATKFGAAGRSALREMLAQSRDQDLTDRAWMFLMRSAPPEEMRDLLHLALSSSASRNLAENALYQVPLVAVDEELRKLAAGHFARGLGMELLDGWVRSLPPEVREAEVRQLASALQGSTSSEARQRAVGLLGGLRGPAVVKEIAAFLEDADVQVRIAAVQALLRTGEPDAMPVVIEALRDANDSVRVTAKQTIESLRLYFEEKERWEKR